MKKLLALLLLFPLPVFGQNIQAKTINNVHYVAGYIGTDFSVRANACIADIIAQGGGTCDAAGQTGNQTISQQINVGNGSTFPQVRLILSPGSIFNVTIADGISCGIKVFDQSTLVGSSSGNAGQPVVQLASSGNVKDVVCTDTTVQGYVRIDGINIKSNLGGTIGTAVLEVQSLADVSLIQDVAVNYTGSVVGCYIHNVSFAASATNLVCNSTSSGGSGQPLVIGNASDTTNQFACFSCSITHPGNGNHNVLITGGGTRQIFFYNLYMEGSSASGDTSTTAFYVDAGAQASIIGGRYTTAQAGAAQYAIELNATNTGGVFTQIYWSGNGGNLVKDNRNGCYGATPCLIQSSVAGWPLVWYSSGANSDVTFNGSTSAFNIPSGVLSLANAGTSVATFKLHNATSGEITILPPTGALSTPTVTWPDSTGQLANEIAIGTAAVTNTTVNSGACQTAVTVTATNALTTDNIVWSFSSAPTGTTDGMLITNAWLTSGHVNFQRCNPTAGNLTPSALTINWTVIRD